MQKEKKEFKTIITPPVKCEWAKIVKPDYKFNPKGLFTIDLVFDITDKEHKEFLNKLEELLEDAYQKAVQEANPQLKKKIQKQDFYSIVYDENGKETVFVKVRPKRVATRDSGELNPVKIFDAKGKEITKQINIGNGSVVRAKILVSDYVMPTGTCGVSLKLNAVQIIDLVEYREDAGNFPAYSGGGYEFAEEEEGEADF